MLEVRNAYCGYGAKTVVKDISFTIAPGELLCLLGPNGVGKTTLFKTILGSLKLQAGEILLHGEDVSKWPRRRFATKVGYVPQAHTPPFPFQVLDVVTMGRTAHIGMFSSPSAHDVAIAEETLQTLGISYLRDSIYTEISGGERQLVLIARALAQQPEILIMDEPTSNLDFGNQIRVLEHIRNVAKKDRLSVILTTHYPNHALIYASKAVVLGRDNRVSVGTPKEVITEDYLKGAYDVDAQLLGVKNRSGGNFTICIPALQV
jgi:iron complex transport system ATP-binding protein